MAKYQVTCETCNEDFTVQLFGKHKDRDWKLAHYDWVCDECRAKARDNINAQAAIENESRGLPKLSGSEKQITWAETIRHDMLSGFPHTVADTPNYFQKWVGSLDRGEERFKIALRAIKNTSSASWWIEHRGEIYQAILREAIESTELSDEAEERQAAQVAERQKAEAAIAEATVRPSQPITETVAEVGAHGNTLTISFPERRDDFRATAKSMRFLWNESRWERKLPKTALPIEDRMAEVGHRLLSEGFCIRIFDGVIRERAVSGSFESEKTRWVMLRASGDYEGWLAVCWDRYADDFYAAARRLTGSRWSKPCVVVPPESFEEILDFAQMHGFSISDTALEAIDAARRARDHALVADVKPRHKPTTKPTKKPAKLEIPETTEVSDDLADEPISAPATRG